MCFYVFRNKQRFNLTQLLLSGFMATTESVYCAVRTEFLYKID